MVSSSRDNKYHYLYYHAQEYESVAASYPNMDVNKPLQFEVKNQYTLTTSPASIHSTDKPFSYTPFPIHPTSRIGRNEELNPFAGV